MDSLHWGKYSNAKVINFDVGYGEYYGKNKDIERAIIKAISKVKKATDIQLTRYFLTEGIVQAFKMPTLSSVKWYCTSLLKITKCTYQY